jgi:three-Cys-motif partner protein
MHLFDWKKWSEGLLPPLEAHSEAKLNVLRNYVTDYIRILCADSFGRDAFKITLVDGFAGGGAYTNGKLGSPFALLEAVAAAETAINAHRTKQLAIDCHYYFIEEDLQAFECLKSQLTQSPYKRFLILGPKGNSKRSANVAGNDLIFPCQQLLFQMLKRSLP